MPFISFHWGCQVGVSFISVSFSHDTSRRLTSTSRGLHSTSRGFHSTSRRFHSTSRRFHSTSRRFHSTSRGFHSGVCCPRRTPLYTHDALQYLNTPKKNSLMCIQRNG